MSDFDKEAEREKLRERFEEEEADRKHTQQLSELLLKGATMTNNHCDRCGDPIFRYEGQTFCPTCQAEGGATDGNAQASAQDQGSAPNADAAQRSPAESGDASPAAEADTDGSAERGGASHAAGSQASPGPTPGTARSRDAGGDPDEIPVETATDSVGSGDAADAEEALRATLTKFSRKAAATDDPGRAREYLAAAREAAEALDALPY